MNVAVIGGGPAGLYLALLLKKANAAHAVTVLERNRPDDTFGWGVVFSDQTLENLCRADRATHDAITNHFAHWDDIDIYIAGRTITSRGHGFSGIARKTLLRILQQRAVELGVDLRFQCEIVDDAHVATIGLAGADLVVAADGVNSVIRRKHASVFGTRLDVRQGAKFIWLGTTLPLDAFTFIFIEDECGVFQAHAYRFDDDLSTFIVECDADSWRAAGLDRMNADETVAACEAMFAPWLNGHRLVANLPPHQFEAPWLSFVRVTNDHWHCDNLVLVGDAAHTAHFSIGSGTKLAMEDAIVLARELERHATIEEALTSYQAERQTEALRLQNAARNSMEWFENVKRYIGLEPEQFAYSLLTRSQRVSHENLRLRDRAYLEGVERWFASRASKPTGAGETGQRPTTPATVSADPSRSPSRSPPPPMFTPFRLRGLVLANRVAVSPMDMYCAEDGTPNDFHLVHLGGLALGGAALVFTEMTCISPEARISLGCTGMYEPEHVEAWKRIVDFVHAWTPAKICFQVGHSGRKGSTKRMWEGMDEPLEQSGWQVMGPSATPWSARNPVPRAMTLDEMESVRAAFVRATEMAARCGFDMLELHCAHGYLLSSFITPLSNQRHDEYGGTLENRLRYPLEVLRTMRAVWPEDRPISVRMSATDWVDRGITGDDAVIIARSLAHAGADIIHVSTGLTSTEARPVYGRLFQTPFSDRIRNETGLPTIAVGNITEPDQVNSIIAAGRADICALARPHLADPRWMQRAAAELGYADQWWPPQYLTGKRQLERSIQRRHEIERAERALRDGEDVG